MTESKTSSHFLLLSATPHNGYKDSFASLLEMINPKILSKDSSNNIRIDKDLAISHICQRRREDVQDVKNSSGL